MLVYIAIRLNNTKERIFCEKHPDTKELHKISTQKILVLSVKKSWQRQGKSPEKRYELRIMNYMTKKVFLNEKERNKQTCELNRQGCYAPSPASFPVPLLICR